MGDDELERLARGTGVSLIAPAGCGKTEAIARAVTEFNSGRELILTHTHAGVHALRKRLKSRGAAPSTYRVETLAAWALRYALAFPKLSELSTDVPRTSEEWSSAYSAATRLLSNPHVREVIKTSYSGLYVDEYQDCSLDQHHHITKLAEILPCRILGDPLQGIFDFNDTELVDWEEVTDIFSPLPDLTTPWRWQENPSLGEWLLELRDKLYCGESISLKSMPKSSCEWVDGEEFSTNLHQEICSEVAGRPGNLGIILPLANHCHHLAKRIRGGFVVVEPIDCSELYEVAEALETLEGTERIQALYKFATQCIANISTQLGGLMDTLGKGKVPRPHLPSRRRAMDVLLKVGCELDNRKASDALRTLSELPKARVFRSELLDAMQTILSEHSNLDGTTLLESAWLHRNRLRRTGRRLPARAIGRTVLFKGLEFDHAVVFNAEMLDAKNLYVALTRGSLSLTIVADKPTLQPGNTE